MTDLEFRMLLSLALLALDNSEHESSYRKMADLIRKYISQREAASKPRLKLVVDNSETAS